MGAREALRDIRAFKEPSFLRTDEGMVVCEGCGARVECRELRTAGWVAVPDDAGDRHAYCRPCSRREVGRYATFLMNGRGGWWQAWQWIPVAVVIVAIVLWGSAVTDRFVTDSNVSTLIVAVLAGALAMGAIKLYVLANMLYLQRRIAAWRRTRDGGKGEGAVEVAEP